jgi:hypothetical protein
LAWVTSLSTAFDRRLGFLPVPLRPASPKQPATDTGRKLALYNQPSQLVVHRADGTIEFEWTYRNDPRARVSLDEPLRFTRARQHERSFCIDRYTSFVVRSNKYVAPNLSVGP